MDEFAEGSMAKSTSKTRGNESEGWQKGNQTDKISKSFNEKKEGGFDRIGFPDVEHIHDVQ
jgi:hypothetical protein